MMTLAVPLVFVPAFLLLLLPQAALGLPEAEAEYGARIDPWLKDWTQAVRISEEEVILLRLHRGELTAATPEGNTLPLAEEERRSLLEPFPKEARTSPVDAGAWAAKVRLHGQSTREDASCPVNGENHLEMTVVDVYEALKGVGKHKMLNLGGLYGGVRGDGEDLADDPVVELLRHQPEMQVLCWNCGDVADVSRVGALAGRFRLENVDVMAPELKLSAEFQDLDLLRLDFLPGGQSCQVLKKLLRAGARPRMVAMLVMSQVPPPFRFTPLSSDVNGHPSALFSCSLAAAADVVAVHELFLLRLTGPYALFVRRDVWKESLPVSELDCYRGASVWGHRGLSIDFVRDWLFSPVETALPLLWGNLTGIYEGAGQGGTPFTLAV